MTLERWKTEGVSTMTASGYHPERVGRVQRGAIQTVPSEHACEEAT